MTVPLAIIREPDVRVYEARDTGGTMHTAGELAADRVFGLLDGAVAVREKATALEQMAASRPAA